MSGCCGMSIPWIKPQEEKSAKKTKIRNVLGTEVTEGHRGILESNWGKKKRMPEESALHERVVFFFIFGFYISVFSVTSVANDNH